MLCERLQVKRGRPVVFQPTFLFSLDKKEKFVYNTVSFLFWVFESDNSKEGRRLVCRPFFIHALKTHAELSELIARRRVTCPFIFHCVGYLARIKERVNAFLFNVADAV